MNVLYYLILLCLFLSGCVSEQWVRGYVQHELAGVKDIVAEEVYPLEKALTDVRTQMAALSVELKQVADDLQAVKAAPGGDQKLEDTGWKVAELEKGLKRLEEKTEGLMNDLQKLHLGLGQVQTGMETISKGLEPSEPKTTPEAPKEKIVVPEKVGSAGKEIKSKELGTTSVGQKLLQKFTEYKDYAKGFFRRTTPGASIEEKQVLENEGRER